MAPPAGVPWNGSLITKGGVGGSEFFCPTANLQPFNPLAFFRIAISDSKTESNKIPTVSVQSTIFGIQKLKVLDNPKLLGVSTLLKMKFKIVTVNK